MPIFLLVLIIVAVVADIADTICYIIFSFSHEGPGWRTALDYFTSPLGAILTVLGIGPWLFLWAWASWPRREQGEE